MHKNWYFRISYQNRPLNETLKTNKLITNELFNYKIPNKKKMTNSLVKLDINL